MKQTDYQPTRDTFTSSAGSLAPITVIRNGVPLSYETVEGMTARDFLSPNTQCLLLYEPLSLDTRTRKEDRLFHWNSASSSVNLNESALTYLGRAFSLAVEHLADN